MIEDSERETGARRSLLYEQVMRLIAQRVIRASDGKRHPLTFTEAGLCRQHKVSRTVVREALKILVAKGLIEVRPKRGIRANPKSEWHLTDPHVLTWLSQVRPNHQFVRELCEVRQALEPAAAELAALRATAREVEGIQKWYAQMEKATQRTKKFIGADIKFHAAILSACHNDLMEELTSKLRKAFRASIALTSKVPGGLDPAMRMHRMVAEAIAQHNPQLARSSMEDLLKKTITDVTELLQLNENSANATKPVTAVHL